MSDIKIKGRKISALSNKDLEFDLARDGKYSYLLVGYVGEDQTISNNAMNFKVSIDKIAEQIVNDSVHNVTKENFISTLLEASRDEQVLERYKGNKGDSGNDGSPGKSAYEIAKDYGLTDAENEEEWIKQLMDVIDGTPEDEDVDTYANLNAIFGYFASDPNENPLSSKNVFTRSSGSLSLNINTLNQYYSNCITCYNDESNRGRMPESNSDPNKFFMRNYNNNNDNYSFIWSDKVIEGVVWIIVPSNFFDIATQSFKDNKGHKYKICDGLMKQPLESPRNIITINNIVYSAPVNSNFNDYKNSYTLFCYSTNGARGKVYFKKIS